MRLAGKRTVITGAGSGVGRATALRFAEEGAKVVCADLDADAAKETVRQIEAAGGEAPEIRQISDGEYLFRNRCSACHTIGGGDVRKDDERIGPDLYNVTRQRDRAWLERWIAEPDAMLEEKDPLAVALYEQWDRVPMPNMRLGDKDVKALLGYIERESLRLTAVRAGEIEDHSQHARHAEHDEHDEHDEHGEHSEHGM